MVFLKQVITWSKQLKNKFSIQVKSFVDYNIFDIDNSNFIVINFFFMMYYMEKYSIDNIIDDLHYYTTFLNLKLAKLLMIPVKR